MSQSSVTAAGETLAGRAVLVAGGTGNVGRHIVLALLGQGATVVVPSRSAAKLDALREAAWQGRERLVPILGDVADERDGARIRDEASRLSPSAVDAVVASLGRWADAPSILGASTAELLETLGNYVVAHFTVARTFLAGLAANGGIYTMINGPSAFVSWPGSALVSVATAAQAMLARVLAEEPAVRERVRIAEVVVHPSSYIGPDLAANGGPIDGRAVGRFVAGVIAGRATGGPTLHLESADQLAGLP